MSYSASLLVPDGDSALDGVAHWISALLTGSLATSLCVIAVAVLGMMMLSGRIGFRRGGEVILGCFLVLGAGAIASGLRGAGNEFRGDTVAMPLVIERQLPPPLPPANYDPYAGASLRRKQ